MKVWKKLSAVALALVMVMALCVPAFADGETTPTASTPETLANGKIGTYATKDTPNVDNKRVNLKKEITVYNPTESFVYGPAIEYTYSIVAASGTELTNTVTDDKTLHDPEQEVISTPLAGETTGVVMTGTETGKIAWTNADVLNASATGTANYKNLTIDFNNVVFSKPGIYRYKITENATYTVNGVTETSVTGDSKHVRYLDVYVMRSNSYATDTANTSAAWKIYGYVCVPNTTAIDTTTTTKTNGFVNSADASSDSNADQYHTYNLTVTKTLNGDTTMNSHKFPFDVDFKNDALTGKFQLAAKVTNNAVVDSKAPTTATETVNGTALAVELDTVSSAATMANYAISNLKIPNGGTIKFIGIPDGTTVTVTETNDVAGTTYTTSATEKTGATTEALTSATATSVAFDDAASTGTLFDLNKAASIDTDETAKYIQGTAPTSGNDVQIDFLNKLALISPTGVTLRYAPYMAMMGLGVVALPLSLRKKEELD